MEDDIVIETEHVEKITRTSSMQQVSIEDSSLDNVNVESKFHDTNHVTYADGSKDVEHYDSGTPAKADAIEQQCNERSINTLADDAQLTVNGDILDNNIDNAVRDQNGSSAADNTKELLNASDLPAEIESITEQADGTSKPVAFASLGSTDKVTSDTEQIAVVSNEFSDKLKSGPVSETVPDIQNQQENHEVSRQQESTSNLDNIQQTERANDSNLDNIPQTERANDLNLLNQSNRTANDKSSNPEMSSKDVSLNLDIPSETSNEQPFEVEHSLNLEQGETANGDYSLYPESETSYEQPFEHSLNLKQVEAANGDYSLNPHSETVNDEISLNLDKIKHAEATLEEPIVVVDSLNENSCVHSEIVDNIPLLGGDPVSNENEKQKVPVVSEAHEDQNDNLTDSNKCNGVIDIVTETAEHTMESTSSLCVADDTCQHAAPLLHESGGQSVEEMCSSIKEPEEHDHDERCNWGSGDVLNSNKLQSVEIDQTGSSVETGTDSWLFLLGHDKLKKRILKSGEDGKRPSFGQLVKIRCCGRLSDGTEVDRYDNLELVLGDDDFIQAFEMCISHMDRGEVCELITDAKYAYGELGRVPDIPKNATLSYEIELNSFEDEPVFSKLTLNDRILLSNIKRERGNYLYSRDESSRAIGAYTKALRIIDDTAETHVGDSGELQLLVDARVKCYNNLAAAQMKIEDWDAALQSINPVLRIQPTNVKALYRKGKCLINKGDHDAAISVLKKAAKLEPDTKIIQQELARLEKWTESQKKSQKDMYKKMLGEKKRSPAKDEGSKVWWWYGAAATVLAVSAASVVMYRRFVHS